MPTVYPCVNDACKKYTLKPFTLCDDCKEAARKLERDIRENDKLERLQYVGKNEGLRRRSKWGGR
jgi:hypothetical protein